MGRYLVAIGLLLLFGGLLYLGAIVAEQQRAIDALVLDQAESLKLQNKLSNDFQVLHRLVMQADEDDSQDVGAK